MIEDLISYVQRTIPSWDRLKDVGPDAIVENLVTVTEQVFPRLEPTEIVETLGMSIVSEDLDGDGYLIEFSSRSVEILVKSQATTARKRFTIAHELGHWVVNRSLEKSVMRRRRARGIESWCNSFAASLLLPRKWIHRFVCSRMRLADASVAVDGPVLFKVSRATYFRRLYDIYGVIFLEVDSHGNTYLWPEQYQSSFKINEPYARKLRKSISKYWIQRDTSTSGGSEPYTSTGPIALELRGSNSQLICRPAVLLLRRVEGSTPTLSFFMGSNEEHEEMQLDAPSYSRIVTVVAPERKS